MVAERTDMATADIGLRNSGQQRILLETEFREKSLIKQVPGARWDNEMRQWHLPITYTACTQLAAVFGKRLTVGDDLKQYALDEFEHRMALRKLQQKEWSPFKEYEDDYGELYEIQRTGVRWLQSASSAILADEMGAGKTVQVCAALVGVPGPHLIICPNSVKRVWVDHIRDWTSFDSIVVSGGQKTREKQIAEAHENSIVVMNYELVMKHSRLSPYGSIRLKKCGEHKGDPELKIAQCEVHQKELNFVDWNTIVLDEAHRIKSPSAKVTRGVWALKAQTKWALTGTPIANHPGDFWSILHFINPKEWPSRGTYVDRYCATSWNPFGGVDIIGLNNNTKAEFRKLVDPLMLRRPKPIDVGKTHMNRYVTLPPKMRKMYNQLRENLIAEVEGGYVTAVNMLVATTRLVQACGATLEQTEEGKYELIMPSPKVDELCGTTKRPGIIDDIGDDASLVVFSASKKLLYLARDAFVKRNISTVMFTGDQDADDRSLAMDMFQAGSVRVILLTTAAGSEGITLHKASNLVFLQRDWSMVKNLQAEDRIHRIGQEADNVNIITIITEDTVDERVFGVFNDKVNMLREVTADNIKDLI